MKILFSVVIIHIKKLLSNFHLVKRELDLKCKKKKKSLYAPVLTESPNKQ